MKSTLKGAILDPATHTTGPDTLASGNNGTSKGASPDAIDKAQITPRERSNLNLRMFKPGQSGNPSGRPKGIVGKAVLRQLRRLAIHFEFPASKP